MKVTARKEEVVNKDYRNWRPEGWDARGRGDWGDGELGAQIMLDAIIGRMKKMGMAPELFFGDDE